MKCGQVSTSTLRAAALSLAVFAGFAGCTPDNKTPVKSICEQGVPGFESMVWWAILAPAGTPRPIVDKLNEAFRHASADPDIQKRFAVIDGDASVSTPEGLDKLVHSELLKLSKMTWETSKPN